jgi:stearoyl-CoA desaturase (delta-9 desaturase)
VVLSNESTGPRWHALGMSSIAPAPPARKEETPPPSLEAPAPQGTHLDGLGTPIEVKGIDRFATATITLLPFLLLGVAIWQTWNRELHWRDVLIFAIMYIPCGLGVTVGFHRLLTHRSFKTSKWLRALFAICGTMAIEGPVIDWVTFHRQHHAYSDKPGDPHSPHVGHDGGFAGALSGLVHAHLGWLFEQVQRGSHERYAPDLLADPTISFIDKTFLFWSLLGLAIPFGLGYLLGGTLDAALTGLLWGGAVRMFVLHHVTYSINSLCHFFGRRRFATEDESRNLLWLAPLSFGESWHNNHHAFPTSAFHGMRKYEFDVSGLLIAALERTGLAWDVQRVGVERQAAKAIAQ